MAKMRRNRTGIDFASPFKTMAPKFRRWVASFYARTNAEEVKRSEWSFQKHIESTSVNFIMCHKYVHVRLCMKIGKLYHLATWRDGHQHSNHSVCLLETSPLELTDKFIQQFKRNQPLSSKTVLSSVLLCDIVYGFCNFIRKCAVRKHFGFQTSRPQVKWQDFLTPKTRSTARILAEFSQWNILKFLWFNFNARFFFLSASKHISRQTKLAMWMEQDPFWINKTWSQSEAVCVWTDLCLAEVSDVCSV